MSEMFLKTIDKLASLSLPPPVFASIVRSIEPILLTAEQPSWRSSTKSETVSLRPARRKPGPRPGRKGAKIFAARSAAALGGHETRKRLQAGKGVRSIDSRVGQLVDHLRERVGSALRCPCLSSSTSANAGDSMRHCWTGRSRISEADSSATATRSRSSGRWVKRRLFRNPFGSTAELVTRGAQRGDHRLGPVRPFARSSPCAPSSAVRGAL
jgi:hypothetical protein